MPEEVKHLTGETTYSSNFFLNALLHAYGRPGIEQKDQMILALDKKLENLLKKRKK